MRTFEEEEEYFNNISKVKQELKDHPDRYERDIVWTFKLSEKKGGVLSSDVHPLRFIYRNGFWGYNGVVLRSKTFIQNPKKQIRSE